MAYKLIEQYDQDVTGKIASHVKEILALIGEDSGREGLVKTPERVAKALQFLTKGYGDNGADIIRSAVFEEEYKHMVLVKDIESMQDPEARSYIERLTAQWGPRDAVG